MSPRLICPTPPILAGPLLPSFNTGADLRRSPISIQELVALAPEAIFLGHGHGDHADNAAYIAKMLGIPIYASARDLRRDAGGRAAHVHDPNTANGGVRIIPDANLRHLHPVVSRGSVPGAEIATCTSSSRSPASSPSSTSIRARCRPIRLSRCARSTRFRPARERPLPAG